MALADSSSSEEPASSSKSRSGELMTMLHNARDMGALESLVTRRQSELDRGHIVMALRRLATFLVRCMLMAKACVGSALSALDVPPGVPLLAALDAELSARLAAGTSMLRSIGCVLTAFCRHGWQPTAACQKLVAAWVLETRDRPARPMGDALAQKELDEIWSIMHAWVVYAAAGPDTPASRTLPEVLAALGDLAEARGSDRSRLMAAARYELMNHRGPMSTLDSISAAYAGTGAIWDGMNTATALARLAVLRRQVYQAASDKDRMRLPAWPVVQQLVALLPSQLPDCEPAALGAAAMGLATFPRHADIALRALVQIVGSAPSQLGAFGHEPVARAAQALLALHSLRAEPAPAEAAAAAAKIAAIAPRLARDQAHTLGKYAKVLRAAAAAEEPGAGETLGAGAAELPIQQHASAQAAKKEPQDGLLWDL
ncbi:hypothetical protein WJX81_006847 [Elliptochloris bilobata]|uniref:Uncharacterized protein n=1 Tax=Elliptochloris bilobata TaxID=381761 RepID=A0AAW1SC52_9CHLO